MSPEASTCDAAASMAVSASAPVCAAPASAAMPPAGYDAGAPVPYSTAASSVFAIACPTAPPHRLPHREPGVVEKRVGNVRRQRDFLRLKQLGRPLDSRVRLATPERR